MSGLYRRAGTPGSNIIEAGDRITNVRTATRLLMRNGSWLCEKGKSWKADSLGFAWSESESRSWRRTIFVIRNQRAAGQPLGGQDPFRSASMLRNNRVAFNIAGNRYRLDVTVNYPYRIVYIRFVGTHADYDTVDDGRSYPC